MLKLGQLPLPKANQKPSNNKNPPGDQESLFTISTNHKNDGDPFKIYTNVSEPKPKVYLLMQ